jgi:hypothetical protein
LVTLRGDLAIGSFAVDEVELAQSAAERKLKDVSRALV